MKIALVTRRYPPLIGGAEKVLSYLARALADGGAQVVVLTARIEVDGEAESSVEVVRLPTSRARFLGTLQYVSGLRRWFTENPVDLAYVSMLKHDAYVTVGAGRRGRFPVVLRPEGAGTTGDVAWQSWGRFGRTIARRCRAADALVAIAPAYRAELIEAGYDPARIHDLPNGVPIPAEPWRPRPAWEREPRAVYVGRLANEKGLDILIDAWPIVRARQPSARLVLVGDGPERPALEARIERLGLREAVTLPGSSADPSAILRDSDLFVLPSRQEGMSIALLEAMSLGIPLVASAIAGNLALVDDRIHGRLAPPDDPDALAGAILSSWSEVDRAWAWADAARDRVIREHSIRAVARRHLELFERLIQAKTGR